MTLGRLGFFITCVYTGKLKEVGCVGTMELEHPHTQHGCVQAGYPIVPYERWALVWLQLFECVYVIKNLGHLSRKTVHEFLVTF